MALLDTGSTRTFCSEKLRNDLHTSGTATTLSVNTLHGDRDVDVQSISIQVNGINAGRYTPQTITLDGVLSVADLPMLQSNVVSQGDVNHWSHLKDVPVLKDMNLSVCLIIGQDYPDLLKPLEVRSGAEGEPYAVKTMLGWKINGPMRGERHHIAESVSANCYLMSLNDQVEQIWKLDSVGQGNENEMSVNDKKVVKLWDVNSFKSKGH